MEITSINNPKIKEWQKLNEKKYRYENHLFIVEDEHLVNEALRKGNVKEIITTKKDRFFDVQTYYVTPQIMKKISSQVSSTEIIAICSFLPEKEYSGNLLVLDRIQDPGNLGAMIRSAVAFNFNTIILSNDSVDLYNPKVIRASEGMIFNINVIRCDIIDFLNNLNSEYIKITTNVVSGKNIKDIKFNKCALVIGNEGVGVSESTSKLCDEKVNIAISNTCESLNASVAASILMYEVFNE